MNNLEKAWQQPAPEEKRLIGTESTREVFRSMSEASRADFLRKQLVKYSAEELNDAYGLSEEDAQRFLKIAPQHRDADLVPDQHDETQGPIPVPVESLEVPSMVDVPSVEGPVDLTPENTHSVTTELSYPIGVRAAGKLPEEVASFIRSASSIADHYKKPYVQIAFENGTGVFTYKKHKGEYVAELVVHPDVVDDLI